MTLSAARTVFKSIRTRARTASTHWPSVAYWSRAIRATKNSGSTAKCMWCGPWVVSTPTRSQHSMISTQNQISSFISTPANRWTIALVSRAAKSIWRTSGSVRKYSIIQYERFERRSDRPVANEAMPVSRAMYRMVWPGMLMVSWFPKCGYAVDWRTHSEFTVAIIHIRRNIIIRWWSPMNHVVDSIDSQRLNRMKFAYWLELSSRDVVDQNQRPVSDHQRCMHNIQCLFI